MVKNECRTMKRCKKDSILKFNSRFWQLKWRLPIGRELKIEASHWSRGPQEKNLRLWPWFENLSHSPLVWSSQWRNEIGTTQNKSIRWCLFIETAADRLFSSHPMSFRYHSDIIWLFIDFILLFSSMSFYCHSKTTRKKSIRHCLYKETAPDKLFSSR